MTIRIEKATARHARALIKDVRPVDREEWELALGQPFLASLLAGLTIKGSTNYALVEDGKVLAVYGAHPLGGTGYVGRAWFVGSNALMRRVVAASHLLEQGIKDLHARHPLLIATAWAENTVHHRWMERAGFQRTKLVWLRGAPFVEYTRNVDNLTCALPS